MSDNNYEYKHITVNPLSLHIGAIISDIDLKNPLGEEVVKEIRKAWVDWKVVFFKNQHLSF
jgi:alpha-ketoglutarate-dependent sulfate ester dioxygenase